MKKELSCSSRQSSIFIDLVSGEVLSYRTDWERIHELYGGKRYRIYRDASKGYIENNLEQLLDLGTYFGNTKIDIEVSEYEHHLYGTIPLYAYVPVKDGRIDSDLPAVVSDNDSNVFFCPHDRLLHCLEHFQEFVYNYSLEELNSLKEGIVRKMIIPLSWYDQFGNYKLVTKELFYYKKGPRTGVNPLLFCDVIAAKSNAAIGETHYGGPTCKKLNLYLSKFYSQEKQRRECVWLHKNKLGYFDVCWWDDPIKEKGVLPEGWICEGDRFVWRREGLHVRALVDGLVPWQYKDAHCGDWAEYEEQLTAVQWFSKLREEIRISILRSYLTVVKGKILGQKIQYSGIYYGEAIEFLQNFAGIMVTQARAIEITKCQGGVIKFVNKYNLPDEISIGELSMLEDFPKMLKVAEFRDVLYDVLLWENIPH